jgi:plasmid replication initiation protein
MLHNHYQLKEPNGPASWDWKMGEKRHDYANDLMSWEGRDEMNLAEFPIAILASRPDASLKTVQFTDRIWDKGRDAWVSRRLTISASDRYGLPTALDDEVILGLIQLTREEGFVDRRVPFSRYNLIRLLGWRNEGKSYSRLETSLKRWLGVTFFYENAWWDKTAQSWVDENFHILERVSIYDRKRRLNCSGMAEPALSMFVWNEVVFRSFQSGYLKQIDMKLFRHLKSPIAKRLYRLLDKRFYHKSQWAFDLRELACEHVGLGRNYDTAQLKRKLLPAIGELEAIGYIKTLATADRFVRIREGQWQVSFTKATKRPNPTMDDSDRDVRQRLMDYGVNSAVARELAKSYPPEQIRQHIKVLDWLMKQANERSPKNPAGYLVQSIRAGYNLPEGFATRGYTAASSCKDAQRLDNYIRKLPDEKRLQLEAAAMESASPELASNYQRVVADGPPLLENIYRRIILEKHLANKMARRREPLPRRK